MNTALVSTGCFS